MTAGSERCAPAFPRIAYLVSAPSVGRDDAVLSAAARAPFLSREVIVEEKLDGANVSICVDAEGRLRATGRSGRESRDRARQFGRLQAWVAAEQQALRGLLGEGEVAYGEWLFRTHSIRYDALPSLLIILDLWHSNRGFASVSERDRRCALAGLQTAPLLFQGVLGSMLRLRALHARASFGAGPAEGMVLRLEQGGRLESRAKWVDPGFRRKSEREWRRGADSVNGLSARS